VQHLIVSRTESNCSMRLIRRFEFLIPSAGMERCILEIHWQSCLNCEPLESPTYMEEYGKVSVFKETPNIFVAMFCMLVMSEMVSVRSENQIKSAYKCCGLNFEIFHTNESSTHGNDYQPV
jgi:hypothetical protein